MQAELLFKGQRAVIETHGGELISYQDREGKEYIWSGNPEVWPGRNPILFPIVGNLKNGRVRVGADEYEMSRHGFARDMEFKIIEKQADSIKLELSESEETLKKYPFPFRLQVCYRLNEDGFSTEFTVINPGAEKLPFCIGAHTAFRCPLEEGERWEDYRIEFAQEEDADRICLTEDGLVAAGEREAFLEGSKGFDLDRELFARVDTVILEGLNSQSVALFSRNTGLGLRMEYEGFPMIAFWTKAMEAARYICLEPWHGCAAVENESGQFSDKPHCVILDSGEKKSFVFHVSPLRK